MLPQVQYWRIVEPCWVRWAIEMQLGYGKSELGVESIPVRGW
jgi:hypothetical protein